MLHRLLPRLRLALARRPWLYWLGVAVCAGTVWAAVAAAQARLADERARWGRTRQVWVTTGDVAAGAPIRADVRYYPMAMVPAGAAPALPDGATAAHALSAGEIVVAGDLAGDDLLPRGWLVLAVPGGEAPGLLTGDGVAVFGSGRQWCVGIVRAAIAERIDVAVPPECAADVSAQLALGAVVLARAP